MPWTTEGDTMTARCGCGQELRCNKISITLRRWLLAAKGWRVSGKHDNDDVFMCPECTAKRDHQ